MRFASPEDYLEPFLKQFPYFPKLLRENIPTLVDLALMHPYACEITSEEIFFGAVQAVFEMAPAKLSDKMLVTLLDLCEGG